MSTSLSCLCIQKFFPSSSQWHQRECITRADCNADSLDGLIHQVIRLAANLQNNMLMWSNWFSVATASWHQARDLCQSIKDVITLSQSSDAILDKISTVHYNILGNKMFEEVNFSCLRWKHFGMNKLPTAIAALLALQHLCHCCNLQWCVHDKIVKFVHISVCNTTWIHLSLTIVAT